MTTAQLARMPRGKKYDTPFTLTWKDAAVYAFGIGLMLLLCAAMYYCVK